MKKLIIGFLLAVSMATYSDEYVNRVLTIEDSDFSVSGAVSSVDRTLQRWITSNPNFEVLHVSVAINSARFNSCVMVVTYRQKKGGTK